jgi:hypothetical protein
MAKAQPPAFSRRARLQQYVNGAREIYSAAESHSNALSTKLSPK